MKKLHITYCVALIAICFSGIAQSQSAQTKFLANIKRYAPWVEPSLMIQTGDASHLVYAGSGVTDYDEDWNATVIFNISNGELDHMTYTQIMMLDQVASYKLILQNMQDLFHFRLETAPEEFNDILLSSMTGGNAMMSLSDRVIDARFLISSSREPELVKLIGLDSHGMCCLMKFPKATMPTNMLTLYEQIERQNGGAPSKKRKSKSIKNVGH